MALDLKELSQISSTEKLHEYIVKNVNVNDESFETFKDVRMLALYEAFLIGANAVYEEMGNGREFDLSAYDYLKSLEALGEEHEVSANS